MTIVVRLGTETKSECGLREGGRIEEKMVWFHLHDFREYAWERWKAISRQPGGSDTTQTRQGETTVSVTLSFGSVQDGTLEC